MSSLVPRRSVQIARPDDALNQRVLRAQGPGIVAAARIQSAAFATNVALQQAAMLSMAANRAFKLSPMGEDIYQAILMAYGSLAATEIQRLGMGQDGGVQ